MPEISKFEQKLMDFYTEIKKFCLIISKFDEDLTQKVDKSHLKLIYDYCDQKIEGKPREQIVFEAMQK